jgi:hypothetical protein
MLKFSEKNWSKLLNYLEITNTKLLYHIINIYLNIIVNSNNLDYDDDYKVTEKLNFKDEIDESQIKSEPIEISNNLSMKKLTDCINKVSLVNYRHQSYLGKLLIGQTRSKFIFSFNPRLKTYQFN